MEIEYEELSVKMTFHIYLMILWSITSLYGQIWPKTQGIKLIFFLRDQFDPWSKMEIAGWVSPTKKEMRFFVH